MKDFKCPQCAGELSYLENQPFVICDYCGSKAVLPDMPKLIKKVVIKLGDEKFIKVLDENVKISPYVGDSDLDEQVELIEEMYRLISSHQYNDAKKCVYVLDRKINIYNSAFIAYLRVAMILIKFEYTSIENILERKRPINDENMAYLIKGSCILGDKVLTYNDRIIYQNKCAMIDKVNAQAKVYFKNNDDYNRFKNGLESSAHEYSKTHYIDDVFFDHVYEEMSSKIAREDYVDFMISNDEVFDFYSIFE